MTTFSFPSINIKEGAARLQIPDMAQYRVPTEAPVFYNFLMELNRDIATLVIKAYQELQGHPLTILLPMAATGVRGIRFRLELPNIERLIMNDVSPLAYELMTRNLELNDLTDHIELRNDDAISVLNSFAKRGQRVDVIDIDPFGSPSRFIDSAIRALKKKTGMICLTATDMAPLCGVTPQACLRKYGGRPLRTEYCHELAIRLCLNTLITTAARYEIAITPIFCYSIDHYIRIYALLQSGALKADAVLEQIGYIVHCLQCNHRFSTKNLLFAASKCPICQAYQLDYAGPVWLGELFDSSFCKKLHRENQQRQLRSKKQIENMLQFVLEEVGGPLTYHNIHRLCKEHKISAPPMKWLIEILRQKGFFASRTHFSRISIRTDALRHKIAQIIQSYNKN